MTALFVYYKLPLQEHAKWALHVRDFQQTVEQRWPGICVELMQRPEPSPEGLETWMEVYKHPQGVSQEMISGIAQLAKDMGLPLNRASEKFIALR